MPWPPEDPDMWAVEARFRDFKKEAEQAPKPVKKGPDNGSTMNMRVYANKSDNVYEAVS